MALEAQASPSPRRSPPRAPDAADGASPAAAPGDPPALTPARDEWPDAEDPPAGATPPGSPPAADLSTAVVVASRYHAAEAKYVPPRAASRTADPDPSRNQGWYSWNGRRSAPPPPRRSRPDPTPPRRQRPVEAPPPQPQPQPQPQAPPPPPPVRASVPAPAPVPPPPPATTPPPEPAPAPPQFRSADRAVDGILSRKRRAAAMQRTALVARGAAAGLYLAALAVLAADTSKGWARDSYNNYSQFRYSEAVNVIGFVYSAFQFVALVGLMRNNKHLISHSKRYLFDFTMDQVDRLLAYKKSRLKKLQRATEAAMDIYKEQMLISSHDLQEIKNARNLVYDFVEKLESEKMIIIYIPKAKDWVVMGKHGCTLTSIMDESQAFVVVKDPEKERRDLYGQKAVQISGNLRTINAAKNMILEKLKAPWRHRGLENSWSTTRVLHEAATIDKASLAIEQDMLSQDADFIGLTQ